MSKDILAVSDGLIVRVTLNRPDEGNAVSDQMAIALTQVLNAAAQTSRLVVLRGAGKDFCVGRATMGQRPSTARKRWCGGVNRTSSSIATPPSAAVRFQSSALWKGAR
jgi:enoyl-CoA hydratase/carnithine racemase